MRYPILNFVFALVLLLSISQVALADSGSRLMGGVSGGGGNVINPMPPERNLDPEVAEDIIENSVAHVQTYLADLERTHRSPNSDTELKQLYKKIFDGPQSIHRVVQQVEPKVEETRPCYDAQAKPVDGSIYSRKRNTICISAYTLSQKVHEAEIQDQSIALMLHEYGELVGLSEDEAVLLQKKALEDLRATK
ncbi:MAG: hypothetical protein FMNOHCHN_03599 [Ignavibacteriaceae bacterium]|nr:hypothetical protein [Ignavibacteriaceae bacterium]GIL17947.1 MAG: hypothetical protein BroJett040_16980 [Oligoflexia bacterium]